MRIAAIASRNRDVATSCRIVCNGLKPVQLAAEQWFALAASLEPENDNRPAPNAETDSNNNPERINLTFHSSSSRGLKVRG